MSHNYQLQTSQNHTAQYHHHHSENSAPMPSTVHLSIIVDDSPPPSFEEGGQGTSGVQMTPSPRTTEELDPQISTFDNLASPTLDNQFNFLSLPSVQGPFNSIAVALATPCRAWRVGTRQRRCSGDSCKSRVERVLPFRDDEHGLTRTTSRQGALAIWILVSPP